MSENQLSRKTKSIEKISENKIFSKSIKIDTPLVLLKRERRRMRERESHKQKLGMREVTAAQILQRLKG